jgi:hypothetical protein
VLRFKCQHTFELLIPSLYHKKKKVSPGCRPPLDRAPTEVGYWQGWCRADLDAPGKPDGGVDARQVIAMVSFACRQECVRTRTDIGKKNMFSCSLSILWRLFKVMYSMYIYIFIVIYSYIKESKITKKTIGYISYISQCTQVILSPQPIPAPTGARGKNFGFLHFCSVASGTFRASFSHLPLHPAHNKSGGQIEKRCLKRVQGGYGVITKKSSVSDDFGSHFGHQREIVMSNEKNSKGVLYSLVICTLDLEE